jgi:hypothetical protein
LLEDRGLFAAVREDHVRVETDHFIRDRRKPLVICACVAVLDSNCLAINVAERFQPAKHRTDDCQILLREQQYADPRHTLRLLRKRAERPCRGRTTDQCDEIASFHSASPFEVEAAPYHINTDGCVCASQQVWSADVAYGSKADLLPYGFTLSTRNSSSHSTAASKRTTLGGELVEADVAPIGTPRIACIDPCDPQSLH